MLVKGTELALSLIMFVCAVLLYIGAKNRGTK